MTLQLVMERLGVVEDTAEAVLQKLAGEECLVQEGGEWVVQREMFFSTVLPRYLGRQRAKITKQDRRVEVYNNTNIGAEQVGDLGACGEKGEVFAVFPLKSQGQIYFVVVMFASEAECSKYKFEMIAHEVGFEALDSEMSVKYQGKPLSIDVNKKDLNLFGTSEQFMDKILNNRSKKGSFSLSVKISKK